MKGCSRTCLLWLLVFAALFAGAWAWVDRLGGDRRYFWGAVIGLAVCGVLVISFVYGVFQALAERRSLSAAITGERPQDGAWAVISGQIRSSRPLVAPMSGEPVVYYEYSVGDWESQGSKRTHVGFYEGKALAPSVITGVSGSYRLLTVPQVENPIQDLDVEAAHRHAAEYIASTQFHVADSTREISESVNSELTDDDGEYRYDRSRGKPPQGLEHCDITESRLRNGETVCVFGLYSEARGGIVPHPNWANKARVMIGSAEDVAARLGKRMFGYLVAAIVFGAIGYGIVVMYGRSG